MTADDLRIFLDMLRDPERTIPIVLICCPYIVDPHGLNARLLGNAVIFYIVDIGVIFDLNDQLPDDMRANFESVRVYLPIREDAAQYHPQFPIQTINEQGANGVVAQISQAYSESLRPDEWKDFVCVDSILSLRNDRKITSLTDSLEKGKELRKKYDRLVCRLDEANAKLSEIEMRHRTGDVREYEELLDLCLKEKERLTDEIKSITERLYTNRGRGFTPRTAESSVAYPLEQAILLCLSARHRG